MSFLYIADDPESKPLPVSMDTDSILSKMKNQTDSVPELQALDRFANFYVVYSTISGPCNVPHNGTDKKA